MQVSYTAGSPLFVEDKNSYPRFFRLIPSLQQFADENVAIVNELNWNRVAIVSYASEFLLNVSI